MLRRTTRSYLPALIVAGVLLACAAALLALSEKAEATFPGKNGKIAYVGGGVIYTKNPGGGGTAKVTNGDQPSYSPNGKRITYTAGDGIYTIKVGGGYKTKVAEGLQPSYSLDGKRIAYTVFSGNSAREALSETSQGFQPSAGKGPAYNASEKL